MAVHRLDKPFTLQRLDDQGRWVKIYEVTNITLEVGMETDNDRPMDYHGDPMPVSGMTKCEKCSEKGIGFNDDGKYLCEDCLFEDAMDDIGEEDEEF